jgi:hypothetical protein
VPRNPSAQITRNCHFILRSLTKRWEQKDRFLLYYDFETGRFRTRSSQSLFAAEDLNSPEVERWLHVLEDPLGAIRPRLVAGDANALDEWPFQRAVLLMLWLQGARSQTVRDAEAKRKLEWLARIPAAELDALTAGLRGEFDLQLAFTVAEGDRIAPLFVPSTGSSRACSRTLAARPPTRWRPAAARPSRRRPRDALVGRRRRLARLPSSLANASIGGALARDPRRHPAGRPRDGGRGRAAQVPDGDARRQS